MMAGRGGSDTGGGEGGVRRDAMRIGERGFVGGGVRCSSPNIKAESAPDVFGLTLRAPRRSHAVVRWMLVSSLTSYARTRDGRPRPGRPRQLVCRPAPAQSASGFTLPRLQFTAQSSELESFGISCVPAAGWPLGRRWGPVTRLRLRDRERAGRSG